MHVAVVQGDILDVKADVLVCSANPWLNLTGGVGAELVTRYDTDVMQERLHLLLRENGRGYALPGEVFLYQSDTTPYIGVIQAVAIDGFYESSAQVIENTVRSSLQIAVRLGANTVALAALATGYGHLTLEEFAQGVLPVLSEDLPPLQEIYIALPDEYSTRELRDAMSL